MVWGRLFRRKSAAPANPAAASSVDPDEQAADLAATVVSVAHSTRTCDLEVLWQPASLKTGRFRYDRSLILGAGAFGAVYKGWCGIEEGAAPERCVVK